MDAFEILGIRGNPKSQSDLVRLYKRSTKLQQYYWGKKKREDAKRVKWAFEQVKKASGLELPEKQSAPTVEDPPPDEGGAAAADAPAEPPAASRKRKAAETQEERREAIREKLQARRQNSNNALDDKAKRQEEIKERLAVKRVIKKVPVRSEDDCKKALPAMLSASSGEEQVADNGRFCLLCPVSIERIKTAARGSKCNHLQCFDLEAFLMSKAKACPVCEAALEPPADLVVDSLLTKALASIADDGANEIAVAPDGQWQVVVAPVSSPEPSEDEDEAAQPLFAATPFSPMATPWDAGGASPEAELEDYDAVEAEAQKRAAEEAARQQAEAEKAAAKKAALEKSWGEALEKKAEKLRSQLEEARKEKEERTFQQVLQFLPKGRPGRSKGVETPRAAAVTVAAAAVADDEGPPPRISSEDDKSYVVVELTKPLGIVFQANAKPWRGVGIRSFDDDGAAAAHGRLRIGDQLVGVDGRAATGLDVDACIGLISGSRSKTVKVAFFRGEVRHLYGKHRPSEAWLEGLLTRVSNGGFRPAPPLARKAAGEKPTARSSVAAALAHEGLEDDGDAEAFSSDEAAVLPAALEACIRADGLDGDLLRCAAGLEDFEGADESLPRAVMRACIAANAAEWSEIEEQDAWRTAALKRLKTVVQCEG